MKRLIIASVLCIQCLILRYHPHDKERDGITYGVLAIADNDYYIEEGIDIINSMVGCELLRLDHGSEDIQTLISVSEHTTVELNAILNTYQDGDGITVAGLTRSTPVGAHVYLNKEVAPYIRNNTLIHELGHALGLTHSWDSSVMTPVIDDVEGVYFNEQHLQELRELCHTPLTRQK